MALRITDPKKEVQRINHEFQRLDQVERRVQLLEQLLSSALLANQEDDAGHATFTTNNVVFKWVGTGGGKGTISWAAAYIERKNGKIFDVPAGSITGLAASTSYWLSWNWVHQRMVSSTSATTASTNKNTVLENQFVIARVTTLADNASLTSIGGGGSEPGGSGVSTNRY